MRERLGQKVGQFTESVIREMTRQAAVYGAVNLSQGYPDFPAPAEIKQAACQAIEADVNQYSITWGAPAFRRAIAEKTRQHLGLEIDPDREVVVTFEDRRWVFPRCDCVLLPMPNTTAELLARYIGRRLLEALQTQLSIRPERLQVAVDEDNGQWGIWEGTA